MYDVQSYEPPRSKYLYITGQYVAVYFLTILDVLRIQIRMDSVVPDPLTTFWNG
jgi:hypothetical protein